MKEDEEDQPQHDEPVRRRPAVNLTIDFHRGSTEFLRTIGHMSAIVDEHDKKPVMIHRKEFAEMVATLELYHDMTEQIFLKYQAQLQEGKLLAINEHVKAIILEKELKNVYNEFYKVRTKMPPELMTAFIKHLKNTALPTEAELNQKVILKQQQRTNGQEEKPA
jgi:hypothetical protein